MKTNLLFSMKSLTLGALLSVASAICVKNVQAQTHQVRTYADVQQSLRYGVNLGLVLVTGDIANAPNALAAGGNPYDSSTLSYNVGALDLIGTRQFLEFTTDGTTPRTITAGTPIYLKISLPSSVIGLLSGVEVGTFTNLHHVNAGLLNRDGYDASKTTLYNDASLASLLSGEGTSEIKVIPTVDCNGVYVDLKAELAGALVSANVFHAYLLEDQDGSAGCPTPIDLLSGVRATTGLADIGSVTGSVADARNAIDDDASTFATMNVGVQALGQTYLTPIFNVPGKAGDSIRFILQNPGGALAGLLTSFSIQPYLGNTAAGSPIAGSSTLLSLLEGPGGIDTLVAPVKNDFDRVEIRLTGVANVVQNMKIYDVRVRIPAPKITQINQYVYHGNATTLNALPDSANDPITWLDQSGNTVSANIPATQATGTYIYHALSLRDGCTASSDTSELVLHVIPSQTNDPMAGTLNHPYSSDVKISPPPTDLPNTPVYVYSLNNDMTFNFKNNMDSYALNTTTFRAGPAIPYITTTLDDTGLPPGLQLNSDGTISGTPTASGDYTFSFHVEDEANKDEAGNNLVVGDFQKTISINASLPITLVANSFKASLDNNKNVVLSWKTASEINAAKFDVLASSDGNTFKPIGSVKAAGNSASVQSYSYTDKSARGLTYYKLALVDLDNSTAYSDVINIDNGKQASATISPNPATSSITIGADVQSVQIFNAGGKLVLTSSAAKIDVSHLSQGVYFVTVLQKDGTIVKSRFIKK